jgi:uncharacterized membrane protein
MKSDTTRARQILQAKAWLSVLRVFFRVPGEAGKLLLWYGCWLGWIVDLFVNWVVLAKGGPVKWMLMPILVTVTFTTCLATAIFMGSYLVFSTKVRRAVKFAKNRRHACIIGRIAFLALEKECNPSNTRGRNAPN